MSCVGLITAEIDQAFGACFSSAVLPAWKRISQTYESGSCQIQSWFVGVVVSCANLRGLNRLVAGGCRSRLLSLESMVWQIRGISIGGVMSSEAVAVVLGASELGWDSMESISG